MLILDPKSPNLLKPPSELGYGSNPFLARWEAFFVSRLLHHAKIIPPIYSLPKGRTRQHKLGLSFERAVLGAILRGDFTSELRNLLSSQPPCSTNKPSKQKFLILYNPNFSYVLKNRPKLCIPDLLIFVPKSPDLSSGPGSISCPLDPSILFPKKTPRQIYLPIQNPLDSISLDNYSFIICIEIKLTYVDSAIQKLKTLYLPIIHQALNLPVVPLVCVKNLTKFSPKSASNLSSALELEIPLLSYLGTGRIY